MNTIRTKTLLLSFLFLIPLLLVGRTYKMYRTQNYHNQLQLNTATGEVQQIQDDGQSWVICNAIEVTGNKENRFCLYKTQNMWTFIMLDTYTGKNWQIQYSVESKDNMFAEPINAFSLAYPKASSTWTNRFQMYETQNMWTFILLDTYDGRLWQIQYSTQSLDNLLCIPINKDKLIADNEKSAFYIKPLTSMYQYYLINDLTGNIWKFQWSTEGNDYIWIEKVK